ncbi:MAG: pentapeptide repeat-containing protein [Actinomycetota bacterium]|nr:pentapeptide repeat-containing protein [Actinomycetota bacterium]
MGSSLHDVVLEGCRFGALEVYDAELTDVVVRGGKLDYVNLRGSRVRDVRFEGAWIGDLDLGDATATRVTFVDCRIGRLDVTRAQLKDVDLRGADLDALDGLGGLSGATISTEQLFRLAPGFAAHLGITVDDA